MTDPNVTGSGSIGMVVISVVAAGFSVVDVVVVDCGGEVVDKIPMIKSFSTFIQL